MRGTEGGGGVRGRVEGGFMGKAVGSGMRGGRGGVQG